jgi:MFS family permease
LLSQNATPQTKGRVFAFHRGMDTLGAVTGPVIALLFLHFFPKEYVSLFYLALIPGLIAVVLIFLLKEKRLPSGTLKNGNFFSFFNYWKISSLQYRKLVIGLLLFALFNSSDIFLLLKAKEITGSDNLTIIMYVFYNLVYAIASYPLGVIADKIGLKTVFCFGLILFAIVYILFAFSNSTTLIFIGFFIYGIYAAATEGIAKAWITNLSPEFNTGTALGFYTSFQSICSLLASVLAGYLWMEFNSTTTFAITAGAALIVFLYMRFFIRNDIIS